MRATDQMLDRVRRRRSRSSSSSSTASSRPPEGRPRPRAEGDGARRPGPGTGSTSLQRAARAARGGPPDQRRVGGDGSRQIAQFMAGRPRRQPQRGRVPVRRRSTSSTYGRPASAARRRSDRLDMYNRAAAHQTTADNPGLLPTQILGPVINFIDAARPLMTALGPRQLPSGDVVAAEDHAAHQRRCAGRREDRARQPEDDDREAAGHRRHLRRLRQRFAAGHRLVDAVDHGHRHQRPRGVVRA